MAPILSAVNPNFKVNNLTVLRNNGIRRNKNSLTRFCNEHALQRASLAPGRIPPREQPVTPRSAQLIDKPIRVVGDLASTAAPDRAPNASGEHPRSSRTVRINSAANTMIDEFADEI